MNAGTIWMAFSYNKISSVFRGCKFDFQIRQWLSHFIRLPNVARRLASTSLS